LFVFKENIFWRNNFPYRIDNFVDKVYGSQTIVYIIYKFLFNEKFNIEETMENVSKYNYLEVIFVYLKILI
jgi:hypothetical protein